MFDLDPAAGGFRPDHLVGILGGMGPAATAHFYATLIARTPAVRDQDHLRVAIWADPTVPDRVGAVLDGSTDPYPAILAGARRLHDLGVTVAAMPCHTAHVFLPQLITDSGVSFCDMVAETAAVVRHRRVERVGLLGTRATLHAGIYQRRLDGLDVVLPGDDQQQHVDAAIAAVKRGDPAAGRELAAGLPDAPLVVLACTELPLAVPQLADRLDLPEFLDPTLLLADAVIAACR